MSVYANGARAPVDGPRERNDTTVRNAMVRDGFQRRKANS